MSVCSGEGGSLAPPDDEALEKVADRIGHRFARPELLDRALTHISRANEDDAPASSNERLEFLGDAVLDLIVSELLMTAYPDADEGVLSQARARAVNTDALSEHARALGLERALRLGRGELRSGGRDKVSIQADVFEAVLGALYLDGGIEAARVFVTREFGPVLGEAASVLRDEKTRLQELLQRRGGVPPTYALCGARGPDHAKEFEVEVSADGRVLARGSGRSKQSAERDAARQALRDLED